MTLNSDLSWRRRRQAWRSGKHSQRETGSDELTSETQNRKHDYLQTQQKDCPDVTAQPGHTAPHTWWGGGLVVFMLGFGHGKKMMTKILLQGSNIIYKKLKLRNLNKMSEL